MRYFEPEAFTFEDYESSFEIFERPDYEATVGGTGRAYLRWAQFSLNMYFKKTALRGPVAEDGEELTELRDAVEFFNANATGRKRYRDIDKRTQDALIIANEQNAGYLAWLRTQSTAGPTGIPRRYAANQKPTTAITTFQGIYNGVFGFSLVEDGFDGAKTPLALTALMRRPSRRKGHGLRHLRWLVDDSPRTASSHGCMPVAMLCGPLDGKEFDDRYWTYPSRPISARLCHAVLWDGKTTRGFHSRTRKRSGPSKGSRTGSAVKQTKRRSQEPSRPFMMTFFARSTVSVVPFRKLSGTPPTDGKLANVLRRGCCKGKASSGAQKASSSAFAAC